MGESLHWGNTEPYASAKVTIASIGAHFSSRWKTHGGAIKFDSKLTTFRLWEIAHLFFTIGNREIPSSALLSFSGMAEISLVE